MGKTSQKQKEKRLAGRVSLALAAGMFSVVPVAHGMPTFDKIDSAHGTSHDVTVKFNDTAATAGMKVPNNATITSNKKNTIIDWKDFSIEKNHTVNFEDDKNFMNIVTGRATSAIDGAINGSGDIYLINPNGVIFGKTASVNVGNLYVSTRNVTSAVTSAFLNGNEETTPIQSDFGDVLTAIGGSEESASADVVNLIDKDGYVKADRVVMEGKNIRFLNASSVVTNVTNQTVHANKDQLILRSDANGYIHVGDRTDRTNNDAGGSQAGTYKYAGQYISDPLTSANGDYIDYGRGVNYAIVRYGTELYNINYSNKSGNATTGTGLSGNYMLADHITVNSTIMPSAIGSANASSSYEGDFESGTPFKGKFDGMFYTISGLNVSGSGAAYEGVFAYTKDARIENLGVKNVNVSAGHAGGIVGYADNTKILNVWNESGTVGTENADLYTFSGGIVGVLANGSTLQSSYNQSYVFGAGLVGYLNIGHISDSYNTGDVVKDGKKNGVFNSFDLSSVGSTVKNVYTTVGSAVGMKGDNLPDGTPPVLNAYYIDGTKATGIVRDTAHPTQTKEVSGDKNKAASYNFDSISTEGASGKTWRIYEGSSLPLLTAFFKGTVSTDYNYDDYETKNSVQQVSNSLEKYAGADGIVGTADDGIAGKTYDAHKISPYHCVEAADGGYVYLVDHYVTATHGDYVKNTSGEGYIPYDKNRDGDTVTRYDKSTGYFTYDEQRDGTSVTRYNKIDDASYFGANVDSIKITPLTTRFNQKDVELANNNAISFALFSSGQQGYDLYGNNFIINKRGIDYSAASTTTSYTKAYDGNESAKALVLKQLTNVDGDVAGLCEADRGDVDVDLSGIDAYYYSDAVPTNPETAAAPDSNHKVKNAGAAHSVYISGVNNLTPKKATTLVHAGNDNAYKNYEVQNASGIGGWKGGSITTRKVEVYLETSTGIDKTYDGTADVRNEVQGDKFLPGENVKKRGVLETNDTLTTAGLETLINNLTFANGMTATYAVQGDNGATRGEAAADVARDATGAVALGNNTKDVVYSNISLTDTSGNYQLVTKNGTEYVPVTTTATLTGTGKIKQRVIDTFGETNAVANAYYLHTYNNENFKSLGSEKHDITDVVTVEAADAKTTLTGLIATDATGDGAVQFQSSGTVYYYDASNRLTENATGSGITVGGSDSSASYAIVEAEIKNPSSSKAKNYMVAAQKGMKYNSTTVSVISKRTISADVTTKDIGKEYDGSADVLSPYGAGSTNLAYTGASATTAENYQDHRLVSDGTTIGITSAKYQITNGEANAADVAFDTSGAEMAKNIAYTIAITGDKAANYNLNGKNSATDNTITGSGTITRAPLVLEFSDAAKFYNGTKVVALKNDTTEYSAQEIADTLTYPTVTAYWLKKDTTGNTRTKTEQAISNQDTFKAQVVGTYDTENWGQNKIITYKAKESVDANGNMQTVVNNQISKNFKLVQITDTTQPITDTNFTLTSTVLGKGEIKRRNITLDDLKEWTSPTNNPNNSVTATYAGNPTYAGTNVTVQNYINIDKMTQILPDDRAGIAAKITIAQAIYNAAPDESTDAVTRVAGDVGTYGTNSTNGKVNLKFSFNVENLGNYIVTYQPPGSDEFTEGNATFTQSGYKGTITPKKVVATLKTDAPKPTKIYDGTTTVKADGVSVVASDISTTEGQTTLVNSGKWFTLSGMVNDQTLNLSGVTATYENLNVQTVNGSNTDQNKVVYANFTNALADGTGTNVGKAYNYALEVHDSDNATVNSIKGAGTINKRHVTVTGISSVDKDYDGDPNVLANEEATVTMAGASGNTGIVAADATAKGSIAITMGSPTSADAKTGTYAHAYVNRDNADDPAGSWTVTYNKNVYDYLTNQLGGNYALDADNIYIKANDTSHVYGTGIINPKEYNITNVDIQSTISKEYDGTDKIGKATGTSTANAITKAQLGITDDSLWDKLKVTGTYGESTEGAGDAANAKSSKPISVLIVLQADSSGHYNYYMKDGDVKKSQKTLTSDTLGKITPRTLYAHLVEDSGVSLTKTYDGTDAVKAKKNGQITDIKSWVQFTTESNGRILTKNDAKEVALASVTVKYADKDVNADTEGNEIAKAIEFNGVGLTQNDAKNYELVLLKKNAAGEEVPTGDPLEGNATTGQFTTNGKILKRTISVKSFVDPADRDYNGSSDVDIVATLQPTLEMEIAGLSDTEKTALAVDLGKMEVNMGQLKGVYGSWSPSDSNGNPTSTSVFIADPHVKYNANEEVDYKDVLYYDIALQNKEGQDVVKNYKIATSPEKTIKNENGAEIAKTVYFAEAKAKGKIKPLAILMNNITGQWKNTPITKTYDGTTDLVGADGKKLALTSDADALGKYYEITWSQGGKSGTIPYTVSEAYYDSKNAGDRTVTYKGFTFNSKVKGDLSVTKEELATKFETATTAAGQANIARRVIKVSADDVEHTKIYDGTSTLSGTYDIAKLKATQNDAKTQELVGKDEVSVTYVANLRQLNASIDPTVDRTNPDNWNISNVTYTFTLEDANYELESPNKTVKELTDQKGAIVKRTIKVAWKDEEGQNLDKTYDGSPSLVDADGNLYKDGNTKLTDILKFTDSAGTGQGILDGDVSKVGLIIGKAVYLDGNGNESADANARIDKALDTREVLLQNMSIEGDASGNYYLETTERKGKGDIKPRTLGTVEVADEKNTREYDGTDKANGTGQLTYDTTDGKYKKDHITLTPSGIVGEGFANDADRAGFKIEVETAIYYDPLQGVPAENQKGYSNAKDGLGVVYRLKWNNQNYTLERVAYGKGDIKPRTLKYKNVGEISIDKTYDGTTDIEDVTAVADGLFSNVVSGDDVKLAKMDDVSHYAHANTGAAANSKSGEAQAVSLGFTIGNRNYRLSSEHDLPGVIVATDVVLDTEDGNSYSRTGMYTGTGRINRAEVTMTPTEVSYYPSQLVNATYSGSASGFVNGDARPAMTFGRDGNTATAAGNYTLLGYVNGTRIGTGDTFVDGVENYYFRTTPNTYLHILAEPVNLDVPDIPGINGKPVTQAITETVISDKKFTPDEFSYARISKDQDPTHMVRESSAALQYSEKGVNLDGGDTKSGLAALADIQGTGSVVNLEGAFIRTSAPAEQPETVAAEAALPVPETEESDISSISLEYAGDGDNSQALLEILTNASSNAEKKGTSIVIDAQDEDKEDTEEEKSRRAIFADRSNIGIETLDNAVNLNQMIG